MGWALKTSHLFDGVQVLNSNRHGTLQQQQQEKEEEEEKQEQEKQEQEEK